MIPYIDFGARRYIGKKENPFEKVDSVLTIYLDKSLDGDERDMNTLLNLSDTKNIKIISNFVDTDYYIEYGSVDDNVQRLTLHNRVANTVTYSGISDIQYLKKLCKDSLESFGKPDEVFNAILASRTAQALDADLIVTNNPILINNKDKGIINSVIPLNLDETLSVAGLLLRSRGMYNIVLEKSAKFSLKHQHSSWQFYWAAARELVNGGWKLVSATSQMENRRVSRLGLATVSRVSNILKCRDLIQKNLLMKQSNSSVDEAIFYFEYYLLNVTASFDTLARVVDEIYQPISKSSKRITNISWRGDWRSKLAVKSKRLSLMMTPGNKGGDVLEFAGTLRNYIHAEGLVGGMHQKGGKDAPILLEVPVEAVSRLRPVVERLWNNSEKMVYENSKSLMLDMGFIVEQLTPQVISVLNELIYEIDFSLIPNLDLEKVTIDEPSDWYAKNHKKDIMRLFGVKIN